MRATVRFWLIALLGVSVGALAVVFEQAVLFAGAVGIGIWLFAVQLSFVREVAELNDGITVTRWADPVNVHVESATTIMTQIELDIETESAVTISDDIPGVFSLRSGETKTKVADLRLYERSFTLEPNVAGTFTIPESEVTIEDPLGIFRTSLTVGEPLQIHVEPRTPRNIHIGMGGERIAAAYGEHEAEQGQGGLNPAELRQYVVGDPAKHIDWKATARRSEPYVREHEAQTDQRTVIIFDHRHSMQDGEEGYRQLDFAREIALTYVNGAKQFGDPLGLQTVGDEGLTRKSEPATTLDHYSQLADTLRQLTPTETVSVERHSSRIGPASARNRGKMLAGDTAFDRTLQPFFESSEQYVRRINEEPLFETTSTILSNAGAETLFVMITDDENRTELEESVRRISAAGNTALVFVLPDVAFESASIADLDRAYRRYVDFEEFRRRLAGLRGIRAFEVAPQDRLASILDKSLSMEAQR